MPLSTTGLQEGDFTALRVLKNGVMQDVLSLTSAGAPDIPLGSLSVAQMSGLQAALNAKATTAALSLAAEALGGEIDTLEVGVGAVATAVASLGAAVASKADASALSTTNALVDTKASLALVSATNTTLTTQLNTLSAAFATKASTTSVNASLALKQDLIEENLTMASGLFRLSGTGGSFAIQRLINGIYISVLIFQYNSATGATRVICPAEFRPTSIGGLQDLSVINTLTAREVIAPNLYSRTEIDELLGTWTYRLPDGSLAIEKVQGLVAALAAKVNNAELQTGLLALKLANVVVEGEVRTASLDVTGTTIANQIMASNIDSLTVTAKVGTFEHFSSDLIFDNGSTLHLAYRDDPLLFELGTPRLASV
jgi:hypothetical protein